MEAQLNQQEERSRDRAVALRALLRDDKLMDQFLSQHEDGQLELKVGRRGGWGASGCVRWASYWGRGGDWQLQLRVGRCCGLHSTSDMCSSLEPPAVPAPPCLHRPGCRTTYLLALLLLICVQRDEAQEPWDSYRNSFTLLMSKVDRWGGSRGCRVLQGGAQQ